MASPVNAAWMTEYFAVPVLIRSTCSGGGGFKPRGGLSGVMSGIGIGIDTLVSRFWISRI